MTVAEPEKVDGALRALCVPFQDHFAVADDARNQMNGSRYVPGTFI